MFLLKGKTLLPFLLAAMIAVYGCGKGNAGDENAGNTEKDSTAIADSASSDSASAKDKKGKGSKSKKDGDQENSEIELIPVEVQSAVRGDIAHYLQLSANLKTEEEVAVYPEIGGIAKSILKDEGDRIEEGGTLIVLDDEEKILDRDAALIDYQQKQAEFQRAKDLRTQNLISQEEFDLAKFNMESKRINFERAELNLRRTRVLAPISGYIAQRMVNRGDLVNTSYQLFQLVDPSDMIAEIHIPEAEIPRIDKQKKVEVSCDIFPNKKFAAKIKRISPVVDTNSGTFRVTIGIHDEEESLRPGMFVNVKVITSVHRDVVLVSKQAVVYENDLPFVYMVHNDTLALKMRLKSGFDDNRYIESLEGIMPGDRIVVVGQSGLKDSATVKIIDLEQIRKDALEMAQANGDKLEKERGGKSEEDAESESDE
ncbi:efflux RND transporter periplasmic adaptor subunit [bacterium]|nr:efflux RND transporter periplasmic adaptor subunit [FCB group bacterium]MBL7191093.1 efflux RND transporter periplasmic adaptor subunit [bacterium]